MVFFISFLLSSIFITVIILLLALIILYMYIQSQTKKYHPIGGTVFNLLINYKRLHDYMTNIAAKHKTFRMISPLHGVICTTDPVIVEYILKTNFQNYGKGTYTHSVLEDFLGDGIFTVDGDKWQEQRKLASHEFSTKVLRDFSSVTFRKNAIKVGNIFSQAAKSNQVVDINDLFMKATADSIFKVAFGIELENLSGLNEEGVRFSRAFDDANELTCNRFVDLSWKIKKFLNIGSEAKLKENLKVVDQFVYKVIRIKREQMKKSKDNSSWATKEDILGRFMQMENRDPKYFRDLIMNFVLAGKDPIAATMTWLIYMLCKHPDVQDKAAKDIKEATNTKEEITNVADFEARVSEEALEKMQYLQATLAETIRLYPALPLAGPRTCLGREFAYRQMKIFSSILLGCFVFKWNDANEDPKYRTTINIQLDGPMNIYVSSRYELHNPQT